MSKDYSGQPAPDVVAMQARIAELEQKLCDSLDAERAANLRIVELERVQGVLVGALKMGHSAEHEHLPRHAPEPCWCSQCQFVRARRAALAEVKKEGDSK